MNAYTLAKSVHVTTAMLSIAGFIARFILLWRGSVLMQRPVLRILPHVNDTLLLGAALTMLWLGRINPFAVSWLSAKLTALLVYILLGLIALRRGRTRGARLAAFLGAVAVFAYIVLVATTRSVAPAVAAP